MAPISKAKVMKSLSSIPASTLTASTTSLKTIMESIASELGAGYAAVKKHKPSIQEKLEERLLELKEEEGQGEGEGGGEEDASSSDDDLEDAFEAAMSALPALFKDRFGEICFFQPSKKKKSEWFPVLVYDPALLTGGGVRDGWVRKFQNGKPEHIIFYYGNSYQQRNNAYAYAKNNDQLVSYEKGKELGYCNVEKFTKKKKLSRNEALIVKGVEVAEAEILIEKEVSVVCCVLCCVLCCVVCCVVLCVMCDVWRVMCGLWRVCLRSCLFFVRAFGSFLRMRASNTWQISSPVN